MDVYIAHESARHSHKQPDACVHVRLLYKTLVIQEDCFVAYMKEEKRKFLS